MKESLDGQPTPESVAPIRQTALSKVRSVIGQLNLILLASLSTLYLAVGDQTAWGEYFTIWPSFFWVLPLAPLLFIGTQRKRVRLAVAQWGFLAGFLLATVEWRSLLRFESESAREGFDEQRAASGGEVEALRIVTWNIDSASAGKRTLLNELAPLNPDICFFQETPDGDASFQAEDLTGVWSGYYWVDGGDCGILSRFPITALPFDRVGPWEKPLAVKVALPGGETFACVNVRLMLPSLVLNPFSRTNRERLSGDHKARIGQFSTLLGEIMRLRNDQNLDKCILAGDFNTPATAASENILKKFMRDAWKEAGCGWGATMTNSFPVSRIDQCWVSKGIAVRSAWVVNPNLSDHRYLVVDLYLRSRASTGESQSAQSEK